MDVKSLLGMLTSPTLLATGVGFLGYKYGKKVSIQNKYISGLVGVGAGYAIGKIIQKTTPPPPPPPSLPAPAEDSALKDYVGLDFSTPMALPAPTAAPWEEPAPDTPQFDTSPANVQEGEGSYQKTSYNVAGVEDAMDEAEMMLEMEKRGNGVN